MWSAIANFVANELDQSGIPNVRPQRSTHLRRKFSVASVQRLPPNASCEEKLERAAHSIFHADCRTHRRGARGLEAAMTGADTPRIPIKFLYGSRLNTPAAARRWGPCELKPMLRV